MRNSEDNRKKKGGHYRNSRSGKVNCYGIGTSTSRRCGVHQRRRPLKNIGDSTLAEDHSGNRWAGMEMG